MQSGREDTLEERYAIKFCFKLGKTATKTCGMLQTAYGPPCTNRSSVFQWHKRFKEGRESVRDDERCGRSREVRTSEMIGQINDFMNRDRCMSIETLSAQFNVSVGAVHIIFREELKMRKICAKFVPRVLREDQRERRCNDSKEMVELINSDPQVLDALVTCDESWIYCYDPETKRQSSQWPHAGSPRPKKARQSKSTQKLMMISFFDSMGIIYTHWVPTGITVNKEYHNSILVTDYLTQMGIKTVLHPPYSPDLAPCDFWLFPKLKENLRGNRYSTIEDMKEAVTRVLNTLIQEDFQGTTSVLMSKENTLKGTRVFCVYG